MTFFVTVSSAAICSDPSHGEDDPDQHDEAAGVAYGKLIQDWEFLGVLWIGKWISLEI